MCHAELLLRLEDLDRGRLYLPAADLAAAGCSRADLRRPDVTDALRRLAAIEVARADGYYRCARALDGLLSTDGRIVFRAMYGAYRTIFRAVRQSGAGIFSLRVSPPKMLLAGAALVSVATGPRGISDSW